MVLTREAALSDGAVRGAAGVMCSITAAAVSVTHFVHVGVRPQPTRTSLLFTCERLRFMRFYLQ